MATTMTEETTPMGKMDSDDDDLDMFHDAADGFTPHPSDSDLVQSAGEVGESLDDFGDFGDFDDAVSIDADASKGEESNEFSGFHEAEDPRKEEDVVDMKSLGESGNAMINEKCALEVTNTLEVVAIDTDASKEEESNEFSGFHEAEDPIKEEDVVDMKSLSESGTALINDKCALEVANTLEVTNTLEVHVNGVEFIDTQSKEMDDFGEIADTGANNYSSTSHDSNGLSEDEIKEHKSQNEEELSIDRVEEIGEEVEVKINFVTEKEVAMENPVDLETPKDLDQEVSISHDSGFGDFEEPPQSEVAITDPTEPDTNVSDDEDDGFGDFGSFTEDLGPEESKQESPPFIQVQNEEELSIDRVEEIGEEVEAENNFVTEKEVAMENPVDLETPKVLDQEVSISHDSGFGDFEEPPQSELTITDPTEPDTNVSDDEDDDFGDFGSFTEDLGPEESKQESPPFLQVADSVFKSVFPSGIVGGDNEVHTQFTVNDGEGAVTVRSVLNLHEKSSHSFNTTLLSEKEILSTLTNDTKLFGLTPPTIITISTNVSTSLEFSPHTSQTSISLGPSFIPAITSSRSITTDSKKDKVKNNIVDKKVIAAVNENTKPKVSQQPKKAELEKAPHHSPSSNPDPVQGIRKKELPPQTKPPTSFHQKSFRNLMAQIPDLSFMLGSSLVIPTKQNNGQDTNKVDAF